MRLTLETFKQEIFCFQLIKPIPVYKKHAIAEKISEQWAYHQRFSSMSVRPGSSKKGVDTWWYGCKFIKYKKKNIFPISYNLIVFSFVSWWFLWHAFYFYLVWFHCKRLVLMHISEPRPVSPYAAEWHRKYLLRYSYWQHKSI